MSRKLGLFDRVFEGIVTKSPSLLYTYLAERQKSLIPKLLQLFHRQTVVEITRYLLDLPLQGYSPFFRIICR